MDGGATTAQAGQVNEADRLGRGRPTGPGDAGDGDGDVGGGTRRMITLGPRMAWRVGAGWAPSRIS